MQVRRHRDSRASRSSRRRNSATSAASFPKSTTRATWREAGLRLSTSCRTIIRFSADAGTIRGLHFQIAPLRAGQAGARRARAHSRCRRRYPPLLADLRAACRGRALGRQLGAGARAGRLRPRLSARSSRTAEVLYKVDRRLFAPPTIAGSPGTIPNSRLLGRVAAGPRDPFRQGSAAGRACAISRDAFA